MLFHNFGFGYPLAPFLLNTFVDMKIAISLFGGKVSPRFDLSPELWIVTEKNGKVGQEEKIPLEGLTIPERIEKLTLRGVNKLICGGIHDFNLDQLRNMGIDVFHNVTGEAKMALNIFLKGGLHPGSHCEDRRIRNLGNPKRVG